MDLHQRMGHIAPEAVKKLVREGQVEGIELEVEGEIETCESCEYAKTTRKNIKKEREEPKATHFGDEIHSDVWGPSQVETINHCCYYASFTDNNTHYTHINLLTTKDETFNAYKHFEAWVETQYKVKIKQLRSDRGGEYLDHQFQDHLKSRGTEHCLTTMTPQNTTGLLNHSTIAFLNALVPCFIKADCQNSFGERRLCMLPGLKIRHQLEF